VGPAEMTSFRARCTPNLLDPRFHDPLERALGGVYG
jgi:hypothetical protein